MENFYVIQLIDLWFHVHHINVKRFQSVEEIRSYTYNARMFNSLIRHREIKTVSDGIKFAEIQFIWSGNS